MYYTAKVRVFGDNQSKSGQKSVMCRNRANENGKKIKNKWNLLIL